MKEAFQRLRRRALIELVGVAGASAAAQRPDDPYHAVFADFIALANEPGPTPRARARCAGMRRRSAPRNVSEYVGFDIHEGPNVTVRRRPRALEARRGPFDAIYAISTFEHLAMPWKAVLEINAVLAEAASYASRRTRPGRRTSCRGTSGATHRPRSRR